VNTIAIIGAGPGLGLAIARTFGSKGYNVALVSRNQAKLDDLVARLEADDIIAAAFPADVLDRPALRGAIKDAAAHFGGIDVLEYSPVGTMETTKLTQSTQTSPDDIQHEIEFQLYGAITATQAVLPAMREAGVGTLLLPTGAGSVDPVPQVGNVNAAAAALRNWAINLEQRTRRHRRLRRPRRNRRLHRHPRRYQASPPRQQPTSPPPTGTSTPNAGPPSSSSGSRVRSAPARQELTD